MYLYIESIIKVSLDASSITLREMTGDGCLNVQYNSTIISIPGIEKSRVWSRCKKKRGETELLSERVGTERSNIRSIISSHRINHISEMEAPISLAGIFYLERKRW